MHQCLDGGFKHICFIFTPILGVKPPTRCAFRECIVDTIEFFCVFLSANESFRHEKSWQEKKWGNTVFWGGGLDGQSAGYDKHRFVAVHGGIYCAFELISDNCAGNHFLFPFWAIWSVGKESMFPFLHKIWGIRLSTKGLLLGSLLGGLLMDILPVLFSPVKICSRLCSRPLEWRSFSNKKNYRWKFPNMFRR